MRHLYTLLHYLALPLVIARLAWRGLGNRGYTQGWAQRFGFCARPAQEGFTLWIHAVSVGEVQAAVPLVRALRDAWPQHAIVVTTTTATGRDRVRQVLGSAAVHSYVPYDLPGCVARFLDRARPRLAIIMETELWPNMLHGCVRRSIPVVLANARMSERSARGYARIRNLSASMLHGVAAIGAQSDDDARRLIALGAPPDRVRVTGSMKFDVALPAALGARAEALRSAWGPERFVWIAASTHEGEEDQVLDAFTEVRRHFADCVLVLAPRHPERFAPVAALCRRRGYATWLRSDAARRTPAVDVFIGDTMGELPLLYAASDVAYVGGSLVAVGGHNMLEPAALGIPVVVGPHVFNFAEISRRLCGAGAARAVHDSHELGAAIASLLRDDAARTNAGRRGREFVERNRGTLQRLMAMVVPLMD